MQGKTDPCNRAIPQILHIARALVHQIIIFCFVKYGVIVFYDGLVCLFYKIVSTYH